MKKVSPHPIKFQGMNPGELVVMFLRRHPIVLWKRLLPILFFAVIPVVAYIILATRTTLITEPDSMETITAIFLGSLFYLFWAYTIFAIWLDYYLDVWMVTTERIMNIEQHGLFDRRIAEQRLSRIQDVTTQSKGILATMMHFGDIRVQTAAEAENFTFRDIPHPEVVAQEVSRLQQIALMKEEGRDVDMPQVVPAPQIPAQPPIQPPAS
jgi:uncharacterized membrane protein YdbT with pleckstrin-like domain